MADPNKRGQQGDRALDEQRSVEALLDVEPAVGRRRRTAGDAAEDRLESEADDFHTRIRDAFLELARSRPESYLVLPAHHPVDGLAEQIKSIAGSRNLADLTLVINADQKSSHGLVVQCIDKARLAGLSKFAIATDPVDSLANTP